MSGRGLFRLVWRIILEMAPETLDQVAQLDRVVELRDEPAFGIQKIGDPTSAIRNDSSSSMTAIKNSSDTHYPLPALNPLGPRRDHDCRVGVRR
jgi:hypothetical protein